jgi:hypothetical protein
VLKCKPARITRPASEWPLTAGNSNRSHLGLMLSTFPTTARARVLSTPLTERGAPIAPLPDPRPPLRHPALMDLSFAALGWLNRSAQAVGSDRFTETIHRSRFNIEKAAGHAATPAELAIITGLTASLDALIQADADARQLLSDSVTGIADACAAEMAQLLESTEGA